MSEDNEESLGFIIQDITRLLRKKFDSKASELGLTRAQWLVLLHLKHHNGIRQTDLTNLLDVQPISMTRMIDRLVKNNWVERRNDPADRRVKLIYLTNRVKPLLGVLRSLGNEVLEEAIDGINRKDYEILVDSLLKIRSNILSII
jgi:DNA-binding MarR family transcriptional regulator